MDFCQRAQTALERDDPGRAMMLLVNGLRRQPDRDEGLDLLLFVYVHHIKQPGMETELLRALQFQSDRDELLRFTIDKLEEVGKPIMAASLEEEAAAQGVAVAEPVVIEQAMEENPGDGDERSRSRPQAEEIVIGDARPHSGQFVTTSEGATDGGPKEGIHLDDDPVNVADGKGDVDEIEHRREEHSDEVLPNRDIKQSAPAEASHNKRQAPGAKVQSQARTTPPTERRQRWSSMSTKRQILMVAGGLLAAIILGSVTVVGWQHARDLQYIRAVDRAMISFDAQAPQETLEVIENARTPTRGRDSELDERELFVTTLIALDSEETLGEESWISAPQTSWGLAASAFLLAGHGEWEEAMQFVNFLERAHADTLAAYYTRGRICEARGQLECALGRYRRVVVHFEDFIPAHTGLMRVSAHRFDREEWERASEALARSRSDHPYLMLSWMDPFEEEGDESWWEGEVEQLANGDRFVALMIQAAQVVKSVRREEWQQGRERCEETEFEELGLLPVLDIACAKAAAGTLDAEATNAYLKAAGADPARDGRFFRKLQWVAPRVLVDLGRAEQAISFAIPFDGNSTEGEEGDLSERIEALESRRPVHFSPPSGEPDKYEAKALLSRARVLNALGATEWARQSVEPLIQMEGVRDRAYFELLWSHLVEGDGQGAQAVIGEVEDGSLARGGRALIAYLEGDYAEAYAILDDVDVSKEPRLVRAKTLALHADGRGRHAIATLDTFGGGLDMLSLLPVRERVFARSDSGADGEDPEQDEKISGLNFHIDRGTAKLWRRDLTTAERHLSAVLEAAPNHPEANWKMGILRRVQGREAEAREHFRNAWRGDEDSTELLIEAGRVQLEAGEYERARQIYLRALLRDRRNVEAIEGLGKAYEAGNPARGRRDLPDLLRNYTTTAGDAPARAELNRWSAIVHGSREGEEEAFRFLEAARDIGGDRVSVLVEKGRYFEARGEWKEARQHYGTALRINPTVPEIHLAIARVTETMGQSEAAREHLEQAMRLRPVAEVRQEAEALKRKLDEVAEGD